MAKYRTFPALPIKAQEVIVQRLQRAKSYQLCSDLTIQEAVRVINVPVAYRTPADCALVRELSRILHTLGDIERT